MKSVLSEIKLSDMLPAKVYLLDFLAGFLEKRINELSYMKIAKLFRKNYVAKPVSNHTLMHKHTLLLKLQ